MWSSHATRQASSFTPLPRKASGSRVLPSQPRPLQASAHTGPPASRHSLLPGRLSLSEPRTASCFSPRVPHTVPVNSTDSPGSTQFPPVLPGPCESPGLVCPVSKLLECSVSHGVVPVHGHLPIPVVSRVCILPPSESSLIVTRTFGGCSQATLTLNQSSGGLSGR